MRGASLVMAALAIGCGGSGADLEITADVPFERVELFVAYDDCPETECTGIVWPAQSREAPGTVYVLGEDERKIVIERADFIGEMAPIHLETAIDDHIKAIAIVAYGPNNTVVATEVLWSVTIPRDEPEVWKIELDTTELATTDVMSPPTKGPSGEEVRHRAFAWPRPASTQMPDPAGCVVMQHWNDTMWESIYFVPGTDHDCDGHVAALECDGEWHEYSSQAQACATTIGPRATGSCTIGQTACTDGSPDRGECTQLPALVCMPDGVCEACADSPTLADCAANAIKTADTITRAECLFSPSTEGGLCPTANGFENRVAIDLKAPQCSGVLLRKPGTPFVTGTSELILATGHKVKSYLGQSTTGTCLVQLEWAGGGVSNSGTLGEYVVAEVRYGTIATLLLPVFIRFGPPGPCPMPSEVPPCEVHGVLNESMFNCVAP